MKEIILTTISAICFIIAGVFGTLLYQSIQNEITNERTIDGIYYYYGDNETEIKERAYEADKKGDWVCVNVAYDMPIDIAYDVCVHECSHKAFSEIFAERCEKDVNKCREILK